MLDGSPTLAQCSLESGLAVGSLRNQVWNIKEAASQPLGLCYMCKSSHEILCSGVLCISHGPKKSRRKSLPCIFSMSKLNIDSQLALKLSSLQHAYTAAPSILYESSSWSPIATSCDPRQPPVPFTFLLLLNIYFATICKWLLILDIQLACLPLKPNEKDLEKAMGKHFQFTTFLWPQFTMANYSWLWVCLVFLHFPLRSLDMRPLYWSYWLQLCWWLMYLYAVMLSAKKAGSVWEVLEACISFELDLHCLQEIKILPLLRIWWTQVHQYWRKTYTTRASPTVPRNAGVGVGGQAFQDNYHEYLCIGPTVVNGYALIKMKKKTRREDGAKRSPVLFAAFCSIKWVGGREGQPI